MNTFQTASSGLEVGRCSGRSRLCSVQGTSVQVVTPRLQLESFLELVNWDGGSFDCTTPMGAYSTGYLVLNGRKSGKMLDM